jgi:hypothetical protein
VCVVFAPICWFLFGVLGEVVCRCGAENGVKATLIQDAHKPSP